MNYGKFVKEEYLPHVSNKKRIELANQVERIKQHNQRKPHLKPFEALEI